MEDLCSIAGLTCGRPAWKSWTHLWKTCLEEHSSSGVLANTHLWKTCLEDHSSSGALGYIHLWKTCLEELNSPVEDLLRRAGLTCGRPTWKSWTYLWEDLLGWLDSPVEDLRGRAGLTCGRPAWKSWTHLWKTCLEEHSSSGVLGLAGLKLSPLNSWSASMESRCAPAPLMSPLLKNCSAKFKEM